MEIYTTGTGQRVRVHSLEDCNGNNCVIHNPSNHVMKDWPTHWRQDRFLMERICPHGIGHPDPDDSAFKASILDSKVLKYEAIHGCDGCCAGERHD